MNAELWAEIKRLHAIEQVPLSEIARRFHLDRKTVRRAVRSERVPTRTPPVRGSARLDPYRSYLKERLNAHPHLPATVLLQELKKQGYTGSLRILQRHLQGTRGQPKEVFLRIETRPGEQAQCDWANCGSVRIGKIWRALSAFVMVLSYSRRVYVDFTLSQCLEDFIQCHLRAFRAFEGVPQKILYDNLKQVVLSRLGPDIRFNPQFMEFAGVFGFEPVPCNVARGNEKGKVENGIYYLRVSFLPGRELRWPDINLDVQSWLAEVANVRVHRTTHERPIDRWEREKPFLLPLPSRPYDAAITRTVRSSHQALVRFESNFYSVPHPFAYQTLILKATATQVQILADTREIAVHSRSFDRGALVDHPKHYEGILATKRKHFHQILKKRFLELGDIGNAFLEGLIRSEVYPMRHLQHLLHLVSTYGKESVLAAMAHAIACNAFGSVYVQNILLQRRAAEGLPEIAPLEIPQRPEWNTLQTEDPDLSVYDRALEGPSTPAHQPDDPITGSGEVPA